MPPQSRGVPTNRLGSSYSTPNLATATEPFPPTQLDAPQRSSPHKHTTFVAGAPSEPVSPEDEHSRSTPLHASSSSQEYNSQREYNSPQDFDSAQEFVGTQDFASSDTLSSASGEESGDEDVSITPDGGNRNGNGTSAFLTVSSTSGITNGTGTSTSATQQQQQQQIPQRPRSLYSYSSRSTTSLHNPPHPTLFAPPFYNRPPTPLPPSPSLTSLLRPLPTFSTHSALPSRPTTPDSSDTEALTPTGSTTAASAITRSARTATTVPRASPKVPTYEYYGFVLYLGSSAAFLMYLLWSYLPTPFLHRLGIYYYPDRWWSLAVPSWLVMALVWVYIALAAWNVQYETVGVGGLESFVDEKGMVAVVDRAGRIIRGEGRVKSRPGTTKAVGKGGSGKVKMVEGAGYGRLGIGEDNKPLEELDWKSLWNYGTDACMDVPIGGVCEILYGGFENGEGME